MSQAPPGRPDDAWPQVWFLDTSALVTLAVHPPLSRAVVATLSPHKRVLVKAVVAELEGLAGMPGVVGGWAGAALGQLEWLGTPVRVDDPDGTRLASRIQEAIAGGRALTHPMQHYGEAAIISLASRAQRLRPLMLCDDYDARIAAKSRNVEPVSIHKLLHLMIRQHKIAAAQAASLAEALHGAGRAPDYTAAELASGRLGRVGRP